MADSGPRAAQSMRRAPPDSLAAGEASPWPAVDHIAMAPLPYATEKCYSNSKMHGGKSKKLWGPIDRPLSHEDHVTAKFGDHMTID